MIREEMRSISSLYLMTTMRCTLACEYCYELEGDRESQMPIDTALQAVDWLCAQSEKKVRRNITFFGGEPLLRPDLLKAVMEYSKGRIDIFNILTNGTIWNDDVAECLEILKRSCKKYTLQVSLDGGKVSHDKYRKFHDGRGSFDTIMENIQKYKTIIPNIVFRQTVVPGNLNDLAQDFQMMYDMCGKDGNVAQTLMVEGGWTEDDCQLYKKEVKKIIDIYRHGDKNTAFNLIQGTLRRVATTSVVRPRGCNAGRSLGCVDTAGNIYPCHRFVAYKNEKDTKIGDVWNGVDKDNPLIETIHKQFGVDSKCNQCSVGNCNVCLATNMHLGMGIQAKAPESYCNMGKVVSEMLEEAMYEFLKEDRIHMEYGDIYRKGKGGWIRMEDNKNAKFVDNEDLMARALMSIMRQLSGMRKEIQRQANVISKLTGDKGCECEKDSCC